MVGSLQAVTEVDEERRLTAYSMIHRREGGYLEDRIRFLEQELTIARASAPKTPSTARRASPYLPAVPKFPKSDH